MSQPTPASAVILCAGFGTRMYPLTKGTAKSLLHVADRPVLDYLVEQLAEFRGLESIHIVTNNRFHKDFAEWQAATQRRLANTAPKIQLYNNGVNDNEARLGAIGDLAFVLKQADLQGSDVMISAGDNIFLFDIRPIWEEFLASRRNLLLAVREPDLERLRKMGVLEIGEGDRVQGFQEKSENPASAWVCPAFYCLRADATRLVGAYLDSSDSKDAIGYFLEYLVPRVEVYALCTDGRRLDIGSVEDYQEANELLAGRDAIAG